MRRFQKIFTDQYGDCFSYRTAAYIVQAAQFEFGGNFLPLRKSACINILPKLFGQLAV